MDNVRIIKEIKDKTQESIYYIEQKCKFLWWSWWSRETMSLPFAADISANVIYDTYEEALEKYNTLTKLITREQVM
jgi:hypothetical protein